MNLYEYMNITKRMIQGPVHGHLKKDSGHLILEQYQSQ